jgi:hypothetical protein
MIERDTKETSMRLWMISVVVSFALFVIATPDALGDVGVIEVKKATQATMEIEAFRLTASERPEGGFGFTLRSQSSSTAKSPEWTLYSVGTTANC